MRRFGPRIFGDRASTGTAGIVHLVFCLSAGWMLLGAAGCRQETPAAAQALNGDEVLSRFEKTMSRAKTVRAVFGKRSYLVADVGGPRFFSSERPAEPDGTDTGTTWITDGKTLYVDMRGGGHSASSRPFVDSRKAPSWWLEGYHLPFYLLVMPGAIRERFEIVKCEAEERNGEPMYVLHCRARKDVVRAKLQAWKEAGGYIKARKQWGREPQPYEDMYVWFFFSRENGLLRGMGGEAGRGDVMFMDLKLDAALRPEQFVYKLPDGRGQPRDVLEEEKLFGLCDSFFKLFLDGKGEEAYRNLTSATFRQGKSLEQVKAIVAERFNEVRYLDWWNSWIEQRTAEVSLSIKYWKGRDWDIRITLVKDEDRWLINEIRL